MSKNNTLQILIIVLALLVGSACTRTISFQVLSPAVITLPDNVRQVVLVNRAIPSKPKSNILEGVLTGEMPGQDKQGRQEVIMGLFDALKLTPAYQTVLAQEELKGTNAGAEFPLALSATEVAVLCKKYAAEALVTLEHYDSDCIPGSASLKKDKVTNKDGSVTEKVYYEVVQVGNVRAGFRIYDQTGKILDEFEERQNLSWTTTGSNALEALGSIMSRVSYMNELSNKLGGLYADRIAPYWIRVQREYYKKGHHKALKIAGRYVATNEWDSAERLYLEVINQSGGVGNDAAKAYYNLGICYEINGELYKAKDCLSKAYAIGGKRLALDYSNVLTRRINIAQRVDQQLHQK
jgi:tetratricopeptide (TPR) repeat protein